MNWDWKEIFRSRGSLLLVSYLAVVVLLNLFLYFFLISSQDQRIAELKKAHLKERMQAELARQTLLKSQEPAEPQTSVLLARKEQSTIVRRVFNLANQLGLVVLPVSYRPEREEKDEMTKFTVTIAVKGFYPELKEFIYGLEVSPISFLIEDLALKREELEGDEVQLNIVLTTYLK